MVSIWHFAGYNWPATIICAVRDEDQNGKYQKMKKNAGLGQIFYGLCGPQDYVFQNVALEDI